MYIYIYIYIYIYVYIYTHTYCMSVKKKLITVPTNYDLFLFRCCSISAN